MEIKYIKEGDKFKCVKDVIMNDSDERAYIKGHVYMSEQDECITDEEGFVSHFWETRDADKYFVRDDDAIIPEIRLDIPEGYMFHAVEKNKVVLKRKLPGSWEECIVMIGNVEYATEDSEVMILTADKLMVNKYHYNSLPVGLGDPMINLCKLLVCRNVWWKMTGRPDWNDERQPKFAVESAGDDDLKVEEVTGGYERLFTFLTYDTCRDFITYFRDLINSVRALF